MTSPFLKAFRAHVELEHVHAEDAEVRAKASVFWLTDMASHRLAEVQAALGRGENPVRSIGQLALAALRLWSAANRRASVPGRPQDRRSQLGAHAEHLGEYHVKHEATEQTEAEDVVRVQRRVGEFSARMPKNTGDGDRKSNYARASLKSPGLAHIRPELLDKR